MGEPVSAVARRYAESCSPGDAAKGDSIAWGVLAHMLFLKRPSRFDRIEVGGVRRQVDDLDADGRAERTDARVAMSTQVVHHEYIASVQLGEQAAFEPRDESLLRRRRELGRERHPAGQANRAVESQVLAPVHGDAIDELAAALDPSMGPSHRRVQAGLVEKNQTICGDAPYPPPVGTSLGDHVRAQTLQRPSAFFLMT